MFLSFIETSEDSHTGEYIFEYVNKKIEEVGPQNIVQVVTDIASNNMAAATLLKEKRFCIYWTSCATHTINLMLEGIGKIPKFKATIEKAKVFTVFIYARHKTLALMRKATKKSDIVRPGVTRFAIAFLTLNSLLDKEPALRKMVGSSEWEKAKITKTSKGKAAYATVVAPSFWDGVSLCLKVFNPLVRVLRLVDREKPSMGFVCGELKNAEKEIMEAFKGKESHYRLILNIVEEKGKGRLDSSLHLTGWLLNPFYFYKDSTIRDDPDVMDAILDCVEKFYPNDMDVQYQIMNKELLTYSNKDGSFRRAVALRGCNATLDDFDPVGWWSNYGNNVPNLRRTAMGILSLTSSSSGCERNWSTFEGIHTKKRNRLDSKRLNNLIYVQFNSRLLKKKAKKEKKEVLLADNCDRAQGWIVEGGDDEVDVDPTLGISYDVIATAMRVDEIFIPQRSGRNVEPRELDGCDFVLEDDFEEEVDDELELESDKKSEVQIEEDDEQEELDD